MLKSLLKHVTGCFCTCVCVFVCVQCVNSADIRHPCSLSPLREPFAKRQCAVLLSEVFQACHLVVCYWPTQTSMSSWLLCEYSISKSISMFRWMLPGSTWTAYQTLVPAVEEVTVSVSAPVWQPMPSAAVIRAFLWTGVLHLFVVSQAAGVKREKQRQVWVTSLIQDCWLCLTFTNGDHDKSDT